MNTYRFCLPSFNPFNLGIGFWTFTIGRYSLFFDFKIFFKNINTRYSLPFIFQSIQPRNRFLNFYNKKIFFTLFWFQSFFLKNWILITLYLSSFNLFNPETGLQTSIIGRYFLLFDFKVFFKNIDTYHPLPFIFQSI